MGAACSTVCTGDVVAAGAARARKGVLGCEQHAHREVWCSGRSSLLMQLMDCSAAAVLPPARLSRCTLLQRSSSRCGS
jgi:hypothetical protein